MIIVTVECQCDICGKKDIGYHEQEGIGDSDIKVNTPMNWIKIDWRIFCSYKCAKKFLEQFYD